MKAMILAAGRGKRMGKLTDKTPKPLLPLAGMPLIEYHVRALAAANIREIVINVSWLGQQIVDALGTGKRFGVELAYSDESDGALETAGGIAHALPLLGSSPFIVVNGDVWSDFPLHVLADLSGTVFRTSDLAHLIMVDNPEHNVEGNYHFVPSSVRQSSCVHGRLRLEAGPEAEGTGMSNTKLTFSGIGLYRPKFFSSVSGREPLRTLFVDGIEKDRVSASHFQGLWWDVGTEQRLLKVEKYLRG